MGAAAAETIAGVIMETLAAAATAVDGAKVVEAQAPAVVHGIMLAALAAGAAGAKEMEIVGVEMMDLVVITSKDLAADPPVEAVVEEAAEDMVPQILATNLTAQDPDTPMVSNTNKLLI